MPLRGRDGALPGIHAAGAMQQVNDERGHDHALQAGADAVEHLHRPHARFAQPRRGDQPAHRQHEVREQQHPPVTVRANQPGASHAAAIITHCAMTIVWAVNALALLRCVTTTPIP